MDRASNWHLTHRKFEVEAVDGDSSRQEILGAFTSFCMEVDDLEVEEDLPAIRHALVGGRRAHGLDFKKAGWAATMEFHYYLRNVQDLPADGQTPNERRFNSPLSGPIIPFEVEVKCYRNNIQKKTRSSASVRYKIPSWTIHWIRLERGEKFDW